MKTKPHWRVAAPVVFPCAFSRRCRFYASAGNVNPSDRKRSKPARPHPFSYNHAGDNQHNHPKEVLR